MLHRADSEGLDDGFHDRETDKDVEDQVLVEVHLVGSGASNASRTVT